MAFVEEDGTGLPNSNSYASVAAYAAYWLDRGVDLSTFTTEAKQTSLVLGTDHIELFFGPYLLGFKTSSDQALEFPRVYLYDSLGSEITGVPVKVTYALFEYAYRQLSTGNALAPDPLVDASGLQIQASFKKVGPIEKRTTFTSSAIRLLPPYPKADALMKEFINEKGGSHRA